MRQVDHFKSPYQYDILFSCNASTIASLPKKVYSPWILHTNLREISQYFRHFISSFSTAYINDDITVGVFWERLWDHSLPTTECPGNRCCTPLYTPEGGEKKKKDSYLQGTQNQLSPITEYVFQQNSLIKSRATGVTFSVLGEKQRGISLNQKTEGINYPFLLLPLKFIS